MFACNMRKRIDKNTTCQCASCTYHLPSEMDSEKKINYFPTSIHALGSLAHSSLIISCVGFWGKHENTGNQNTHDEPSARFAYHASDYTQACLGRTRCCCCCNPKQINYLSKSVQMLKNTRRVRRMQP
ncbi:unnamed protein product [Ectocarpus sp. 13 AM-2016]